MTIPFQHNIGGYLRTEPILPPGTVVSFSSDGAPNATEVAGRIIDRLALGRHYLSVKVAVPYHGNFQSSKGAQITLRALHATSTAAGDFAAFGSTGITRLFATTTTATSTSHAGVAEFEYDLRTARRYLQFDVTPTHVASSSGGFSYGAVAIFGGADELAPVAPVDRATTS